jgi:mono/diheme cytochrome c family protein
VFARVCSSCHSRGGTSGIDMSSYKSWATRVDIIDTRVLQIKNMPTNQKLSGDDLATIGAWVGCQRQPATCPAP